MFDPLSISAFVSASKALADLKGHFVSEEKKSVLDFIEFCDSVYAIIQLASLELKKDDPEALGEIGARLGAWAGSDKFVDPVLKEQRDNLSKSIKELSAEFTKLYPKSLSLEDRAGMQRQLNLLSGHLKGLAEVLRFESKFSQDTKTERGSHRSNWPKWLTMVAAPAVSVVATATVAAAAEYIPAVGPTIAEFIRGSSDGGSTNA